MIDKSRSLQIGDFLQYMHNRSVMRVCRFFCKAARSRKGEVVEIVGLLSILLWQWCGKEEKLVSLLSSALLLKATRAR